MRFLDAAFRNFLATLCALLLLAMLAAVIGQIISRYGFNSPLAWSEELARYSMIRLAMLGSGLAMREGQHIAINSLTSGSGIGAKLVRWGTIAIMGCVIGAFGYYALKLVSMTSMQRTPSLGVRMSMVYLALPVGVLLTIAGFFLRWRDDAGDDVTDEPSTHIE